MVADIYLQLRDLVLSGDPSAHGWAPTGELPHVWGVLVEVGLTEGPATLVSLVDGTTSLYLGNGGATIGAGETEAVADATRRLLVAVERALVDLHPIWEFPIPERGQVRVVALTYSGPLGAVAAEADLASSVGPLARAYAASAVVLDGISRVEAAAAAAGGPSSVGEQFE